MSDSCLDLVFPPIGCEGVSSSSIWKCTRVYFQWPIAQFIILRGTPHFRLAAPDILSLMHSSASCARLLIPRWRKKEQQSRIFPRCWISRDWRLPHPLPHHLVQRGIDRQGCLSSDCNHKTSVSCPIGPRRQPAAWAVGHRNLPGNHRGALPAVAPLRPAY